MTPLSHDDLVRILGQLEEGLTQLNNRFGADMKVSDLFGASILCTPPDIRAIFIRLTRRLRKGGMGASRSTHSDDQQKSGMRSEDSGGDLKISVAGTSSVLMGQGGFPRGRRTWMMTK